MDDFKTIYGFASIRPQFSPVMVSETTAGGAMRITFVEVVLAVAVLLVVGTVGYGLYHRSQMPGFELKKAEWACGKSHEETITTFVNVGGKAVTLVPIYTTSTVCDAWIRK
jgi:hypothetical protein